VTIYTDKIADASSMYVHAIEDRRRLAKERAAIECEHVMPSPDESLDADGRLIVADGRYAEHPCWKWVSDFDPEHARDNGGRYGEGSDFGWCPSCERRQRINDLYVLAGRKIGPAYLRLRLAVLASTKITEATP